MKKLLAALLLAACALMPVCAQESDSSKPIWDHGNNVSDMYYENLRILKIFDDAEGYVVYYEKGGLDVGQVIIPKSWYNEKPARLEFRIQTPGISPYITIIKKSNDFQKVILTVPTNRNDPTWGVLKSWESVNVTNRDTLVLK